MSTNSDLNLAARSVTHDYSGVVVLRDVSFALRSGSVHALTGENGSGKSTLLRILTGALRPRRGSVELAGERLDLHTPGDAIANGVAFVHQDYNVFPDLTVADNIVGLSTRSPKRVGPLLDRHRAKRQAAKLLEELGTDIDPARRVGTLEAPDRKLVEIARAMVVSPQFLILDEPTASFGPSEAKRILELLDRLRSAGVGICFVSHRLDEVVSIADEATVLRDGRVVGQVKDDLLTEARIAEMMVGRTVNPFRRLEASRRNAADAPLVEVGDAHVRAGAAPVSLEVRRGEILGLTGLVGAGAQTVVRMLGGITQLKGQIRLAGQDVTISSPRSAARLGIGYIPEDRRSGGLIPDMSVELNLSLASLAPVCSYGFIRRSAVRSRAQEYQRLVDIRANSLGTPVRFLSGGNQQKVLLAKWLASGVRVLAIEEPTHGVDIRAKEQIHEVLRAFVSDGGAIVVASTDGREILSLCERVAVFRHGSLAAHMPTPELSEADLTALLAADITDRPLSEG